MAASMNQTSTILYVKHRYDMTQTFDSVSRKNLFGPIKKIRYRPMLDRMHGDHFSYYDEY